MSFLEFFDLNSFLINDLNLLLSSCSSRLISFVHLITTACPTDSLLTFTATTLIDLFLLFFSSFIVIIKFIINFYFLLFIIFLVIHFHRRHFISIKALSSVVTIEFLVNLFHFTVLLRIIKLRSRNTR